MKKRLFYVFILFLFAGFIASTTIQPANAQVVIPEGSTIDSAIFSIFVTNPPSSHTVRLHRITADWDENSVTWNNFGGSYDPAIIGSFVPSVSGWHSVDITALVQDWVDGDYPNYGILLEQGQTIMTQYISSDYVHNVDLRPKLDIWYTTPVGLSEHITIQRPGVEQDGVADAYIWESLPDATRNEGTLYSGLVNGYEKQSLIRFFFITNPPCIEVHKFNDANANSIQDPGELDLDGWLIRIYDLTGTFLAEGRTDGSGNVSFCGFFPDPYMVWEEQRECWEPTTPVDMIPWDNGYYTSVTIEPGQSEVIVDFGNRYTCGGPGTGTPGYWKNHPDAWPVDEITIGGFTYTKEDAIAIMKTSGKGDKTYDMFNALVAAMLNVLIGNDDSCIADTIINADLWMTTYGPVGSDVRAGGKNSPWRQGENFFQMLDDYNNGYLSCADHRD